ncbi:MAG: hypothetical protein E7582_05635 [Ruminococcaceae bacterium]|nr:hypothetical protein [Oscillospiraceae bacterium]
MGKIIMVASLKGGVGKTTVTAGLSHALAKMGHKTLAVDMDFGVRSLDIALGHENSTCPGCWDVMTGKASLGVAADGDERSENLFFMSAPMNVDCTYDESLTDKMFRNFLKSIKREYDYVLLDMAAGTGRLLDMASDSGELDTILVVCTQNAASVRAAEKLGSSLFKKGDEKIRLIINSFDPDRAGKEDSIGVVDIIDHSSVTLLGVIPYDKRVEKLISSGKTVIEDKRSKAGKAVLNLAKRICGIEVPLFEGTLPRRKRLKFY